MAFSQVGIVNLALIKLGARTISAMADTSPQAIAANAIYDYLLDEVLEEEEWVFATYRATLAQDSTAPDYGYEYRYARPTGAIKILEVSPECDFVVEGDYILTDWDDDDEDLHCRYIKRVTDPTKYGAKFCKALALRIAADLAVILQQSTSLKNELMAEYRQALYEAKAHNQSFNYLKDEKGNEDLLNAGRT